MTYNKRDKVLGEPVSKEEVLKDLGHPASWSALSRKLEFKHRLKPGQTELDLGGIKGVPGNKGYLEFLEKEFQNPLGSNTGLVSDKENVQILADNRAAIQLEIDKYRMLLEKYEQDPREIARYVGYMDSWLNTMSAFYSSSTEKIGDSDLDSFFESEDKKDAENLETLKARIVEYASRYENLTGQKLDLEK